MPKHDYLCFFPFPKIREEQKKAIEFAIDSFESGKRFVILELGTGVGKSATGITIARYMEAHFSKLINEEGEPITGSYVVTTQKILQDQYLRDFGSSGRNLLRSIKSSSNYQCSFYNDQTCSESKQLLSKLGKHLNGTDFQKHCKNQCPYSLDKQEFIDSSISVTNFPYILAESSYSGKLEPRAFMVVDEAHNTEAEISKFVEVTFSEKFAKDVLKCKLPRSDSQTSIFDWIKTAYRKAAKKYFSDLEKSLLKIGSDTDGYSAFSKQYEMLDKHLGKVDQFIEVYSPTNWIMNTILPSDPKKGGRKFEFKSIDVSHYSNKIFFRLGQRVLLMSATIVDKNIFCESLGIAEEEVSFLSIQSPFPVKNRPVNYISAGSMSKNAIDKSLPIAIEVIKMILDKHPDQKGILHATNYKVAKYIQENISSSRLLFHDSTNREKVLKLHIECKEPTVLISPSMMEGVDLYDDLSRFQIICKVPFPYLGDLVVKKRMEKNKDWYSYMTAKLIIQSLGRSIRNENDFAESYIIDSDWERFYRNNRKMFPDEFHKSLV